MYQKILAPLDGSELTECTLEHVKAIALGCKVPQVVLLTIMEPVLPDDNAIEDFGAEFHRDIMEKGKADLQNYLSRVTDNLKKEGVAAEAVVLTGRAAEQILGYASKNQVDLIIMSTHGRSGVARWALGSVSDRVLRHSPVPVLVIAPEAARVSP